MHDHTGTRAAGRLDAPRADPHTTAVLALPPAVAEHRGAGVLTVAVVLAEDTAWAPAGHEIAWCQAGGIEPAPAPAGPWPPPTTTWDGIEVGPAVFDPDTGRLRTLHGVPVQGPELGLWRAPTDNDLGGHPAPDATVWAGLGLDRLQRRTVEVTAADDGLVVVRRSAAAGHDRAVDVRYHWRGDGTGLGLSAEITPVGQWPGTWARIGLDLVLPGAFTEVAWAGLGPGPAYPDTGQAQRLGWFSAAVAELDVGHVRPQENGARAGVTRLELRDPATGARIGVRGPAFSFTARRWSQRHLAAARHTFDLVPDGRLHLLLDRHQHGIGTAACGPGVLPAHRLTPRATRFDLWFD